MSTRFGWDNFLVRLAVALLLVFATYNPEGEALIFGERRITGRS